MIRPTPHLVIDARPRGPRGPLAGERVLGRPVLDHLIDLARAFGDDPVAVHARLDEHDGLRAAMSDVGRSRIRLVTGPPPENASILRSDRLYDAARLKRAIHRGKDVESAVIWRLDRPRGLDGADDELVRRRTYQPIGRFWALAPARWLALKLQPTRVRPNMVTLASGGLMLGASSVVALGETGWVNQGLAALAMAASLVLDTSDGHLARLQGTASEFGRWLDANLDELGDMALHSAIAWSAYARSGQVAWLMVGMVYVVGKYLFLVGVSTGSALEAEVAPVGLVSLPAPSGRLRTLAHLVGHADVRWHLWIVLAALGRLELALAGYALYFPVRALAGAWRKAARHG